MTPSIDTPVETPAEVPHTNECVCFTPGYCYLNRRNMTPGDLRTCHVNEKIRAIWRRIGAEIPEPQLGPPCGLEPVPLPAAKPSPKVEAAVARQPRVRAKAPRVGLGDVVAKYIGRPLKPYVVKAGLLPEDCDCPARQAKLNRWLSLPFIRQGKVRHKLRWACFMRTAPRPGGWCPIAATLESYLKAGWNVEDLTIYAEPGSPEVADFRVVRRDRLYGAWNNFIHALAQTVQENPDADVVVGLEDDWVGAKRLCQFFEDTLWPDRPERIGVVQPYCGAVHRRQTRKSLYQRFYQTGSNSLLWGSVFVLMPMSTARLIVDNQEAIHHARHDNIPGVPRHQRPPARNQVDGRLTDWLMGKGLGLWYLYPSLVQHINGPSSLNHPWGERVWKMYASTFVGEEFDAHLEAQGLWRDKGLLKVRREKGQAGNVPDSLWDYLVEHLKPGMRTVEHGTGETTHLFEELECDHTALEFDLHKIPRGSRTVQPTSLGADGCYDYLHTGVYDLALIHGTTPSKLPPAAVIIGLDDPPVGAEQRDGWWLLREVGDGGAMGGWGDEL